MSRKLTIGMPCYDDFEGVWSTIQSLRMHHPEAMDDVEFLIVDNNPDSAHGKAVAQYSTWIRQPIKYVPFTTVTGAANAKQEIFNQAETPYVLCMDCHILIVSGAIQMLIEGFDGERDEGHLIHGPMLYDDMTVGATHMDPVWRGGMLGIWAVDKESMEHGMPFEIPAHGMGLFACRKDTWKGFNPLFRGFGGEECYIHEKFRHAGKTSICLPFLKWLHRFGRPGGAPYRVIWEDRIWNYLIGHAELGLDPQPVLDHFAEHLGKNVVVDWVNEQPKHITLR